MWYYIVAWTVIVAFSNPEYGSLEKSFRKSFPTKIAADVFIDRRPHNGVIFKFEPVDSQWVDTSVAAIDPVAVDSIRVGNDWRMKFFLNSIPLKMVPYIQDGVK